MFVIAQLDGKVMTVDVLHALLSMDATARERATAMELVPAMLIGMETLAVLVKPPWLRVKTEEQLTALLVFVIVQLHILEMIVAVLRTAPRTTTVQARELVTVMEVVLATLDGLDRPIVLVKLH